jgi:hypothetical protein
MLKIRNFEEMQENFDGDGDQRLNSDEQINILQLLKIKCQETARLHQRIQQYQRFKELMATVRRLEQYITGWQDQLRTMRHSREQHRYF